MSLVYLCLRDGLILDGQFDTIFRYLTNFKYDIDTIIENNHWVDTIFQYFDIFLYNILIFWYCLISSWGPAHFQHENQPIAARIRIQTNESPLYKMLSVLWATWQIKHELVRINSYRVRKKSISPNFGSLSQLFEVLCPTP